MTEEAKTKGGVAAYPYPQPPPPPFQGVGAYPHPPPPAAGFPQAVPPPPPAAGFPQAVPPPQPQYYPQPVPGYAVEEGRVKPARERLPCCGCGLGWVLFIIGFFLGAIPWYIGTIILLIMRNKLDQREKSGYFACAIAAVIGTIIIIIAASTGAIHR